jgi:magnesium transporter
MMNVYTRCPGPRVEKAPNAIEALAGESAVWIDLDDPTGEEEEMVESLLGIDVPIPAERAAFEDSARFYQENGALFATATLLGRREEGAFVSDAVTFILVRDRLVTVRKIKPRAFEMGEGRSSARISAAPDGAGVFLALLEGCIERLADVIAEGTRSSQTIAGAIFTKGEPDLRATLRTLGHAGTVAAMAQDSLSSLQRATGFAATVCAAHGIAPERMEALRRDVEELERTAQALQSHLAFLQDATIGLVGASQSNTLKALSLATIAFVPPTLIASVFGMNLGAISWFDQRWGPIAAFGLMVAAPFILFSIAKWRKWF